MATMNTVDVNERDFSTTVLERSSTVPVVVDFWAPWCGPCRVLGPTLERLAAEMDGAFVLAKVNVDENQRLAGQFGIQGIPAVKAFRDGKVVDEFTGALPESRVRAWLNNVVPSEVDQLSAAGATRLEAGDALGAAELFRKALRSDGQHGRSLLGLGRALTLLGDPQAAPTLKLVRPGMPEYPAAEALLGLAPLLDSAPDDPAPMREQLAHDPGSSSARWQLAAHLARRGEWEDALRHLLALVQRDRAFDNDAARRAMLAIFALLGERSAVAAHYRRQLASAVF